MELLRQLLLLGQIYVVHVRELNVNLDRNLLLVEVVAEAVSKPLGKVLSLSNKSAATAMARAQLLEILACMFWEY